MEAPDVRKTSGMHAVLPLTPTDTLSTYPFLPVSPHISQRVNLRSCSGYSSALM